MTIQHDQAQPLAVDSFDIAEHVQPATVLEAARTAARLRADDSVRSARMTLPHDGGWMRIMAAALPELDVLGYKEFHLSPGNAVRYAVHVFTLSDGRPLGVVDAAITTTLRTSASAAIAAEAYFGVGTAVRLGVIGSGDEAMAGVRALNAVLALRQVQVTSRSAANREKFAASAAEEMGLDIRPVGSCAEVTRGCDMVYIATNSGGKVVVGLNDLRAVPFVASIGSTLPVQRELDDDVLAVADAVVVDTLDVLSESGDALAAAAHGLDRDRVSLVGTMASRSWDRSGLTVYKSIGSPEQDVVLAHAILHAADAGGFGRRIEPLSTIKQNL